jgi:hypothetical protein
MNARVRPPHASGRCRGWTAAAGLAVSCLPLAAAAQESPQEVAAAFASGAAPTGVMEVTTQAPLLDLGEVGGTRVEAARWRAARPGQPSYGVALGMSAAPSTLAPSTTVLQPSVGLRFRSPLGERRRLDVATWRDLPPQREANFAYSQAGEPERLTTTRVEMQFAPPKGSGFAAELGAVGFQMSANSKLQLRVRKGGPMVYYRSKF